MSDITVASTTSATTTATATSVAAKRKFLVVNCDDNPKWKDFDDIFIGLFGDRATDDWTFLMALTDELPSTEQIAEYDGILLPGSRFTTYEDEKYLWIKPFHEFVRRIDAVPDRKEYYRGRSIAGPRVVGICFGAQSIAHSLGGRCGKNQSKKFAFGTVCVSTTSKFAEYVRSLGITATTASPAAAAAVADENVSGHSTGDLFMGENQLRLLESHGDSVQVLPSTATLLATSPDAPYDQFTLPAKTTAAADADGKVGSGAVGARFWAVQSHPEFWPGVMMERILPNVLASGAVPAEAAEKIKSDTTHLPLSSKPMMAVLRAFLRS